MASADREPAARLVRAPAPSGDDWDDRHARIERLCADRAVRDDASRDDSPRDDWDARHGRTRTRN